jgi:hypothetical protein
VLDLYISLAETAGHVFCESNAMNNDVVSPAPSAPASPMAAGKHSTSRKNKAREAALKIRKELWPHLQSEDVWSTSDKKRVGFAQVPRILSLAMNMINDVSKRQSGKAVPAGRTYLVLWLHVYGDGIVRIDSEEAAAYEAGYGGERNRSTFRAHMKCLKAMGFIDYAKGPRGPFQWVLLRNPFQVVKQLRAENLITKDQYVAFVERATYVGSAGDLGDEHD